jgi:glucose/mannose transport system substrate-binding protein
MKALSIAALALATASPLMADPRVEVMHFWTSGGEAAALGTVRDKVVAAGTAWTDAPIAGGGGDAAKTALQARIAGGNPPAAMLMLGQNIIDWANEGMLGNVDALAEAEGWDAALPQAVQDFTRIGGHWVSVPTNVHRTDMIWASKSAFDRIGAAYPTTWDELNALAPQFAAAGIVPLAHGGQAWQEAYMFEAVALGVGGADFYRKALIDLDEATLRSDTMVMVFEQLDALRAMVDPNFPGRDWNLASAMVINGEAAMQIMGDWAKGEFTNAGKIPGDDYACIPVPKAQGDGFVYLVNSLSLFAQSQPDLIEGQGFWPVRSWTPACRWPSTRPRVRSRRGPTSTCHPWTPARRQPRQHLRRTTRAARPCRPLPERTPPMPPSWAPPPTRSPASSTRTSPPRTARLRLPTPSRRHADPPCPVRPFLLGRAGNLERNATSGARPWAFSTSATSRNPTVPWRCCIGST